MELVEKRWTKETEGFLIAAQDQALRTNTIKVNIDKVTENSKCRLFKEKDKTINHLIEESYIGMT